MEDAELYSSANGMQKKDAKEILTEFRDKIKWRRNGRILDVGCGSGEVTTEIILPQLPKDFQELTGLDISTDMIKHARNLHSEFNVTFIQFDIAKNSENILKEIIRTTRMSRSSNKEKQKVKIPKEEDQNVKLKLMVNGRKDVGLEDQKMSSGFDVVLSFYCLHWVTNQKVALKNIYRVLKPGGEALLTFLVQSPIFTLYRELSKTPIWKEYMQDVNNFIPFYQDSDSPVEKFVEIVEDTGFLVLTSDCREKNYVFENYTSLKNAIAAVNPFIPRIPSALQKDYINECLYKTETLNLASVKNNHYRVAYKLMVAHIRKPESQI